MEQPGGTTPAAARPDFADVLSSAIAARGATLAHLRRRLDELGTPISVTPLSYWRSGRRRPAGAGSARTIGNLEHVLGLEPGRLGGVAPPRPERSDVRADGGGVDADATDGDRDDRVAAVLRRLDAPENPGDPGDPGLSDDSVQHVLDVDGDGCPCLVRVRCLHRATRDGVDRRVLVVTKRHPDGAARRFTALAGGRIARTADDPDAGVYAAEFVFDAPLRAGDTVVIEYQMELGSSEETFYELAVRRRLRHAMVWVRFDPARVPTHVELYRDSRRGGRVVRPVDVTATASVHHAVSGGASTRIGVRWSW